MSIEAMMYSTKLQKKDSFAQKINNYRLSEHIIYYIISAPQNSIAFNNLKHLISTINISAMIDSGAVFNILTLRAVEALNVKKILCTEVKLLNLNNNSYKSYSYIYELDLLDPMGKLHTHYFRPLQMSTSMILKWL